MLTPNKWFRANYGEDLRILLRNSSQVQLVVDFGHSRTLFADADTFPAAVSLSRTQNIVGDDVPLKFVRAHDSDREHFSLQYLIRERFVLLPHRNLRSEQWYLENPEQTRVLDRLRNAGISLADFVGHAPITDVNTGLNEAYYIDGILRKHLIEEDPACEPLIKPFLRGRDVKRWRVTWDDTWHIVIASSTNYPWPWASLADEDEAEEVFHAQYPGLHRHLKRYEPALRNRTARGKYWWELRSCDYYEEYGRSKIIVQCIAYFSQFALDSTGHYVNNKVLLIPSDDLYLLAVLNSRVAWWMFNRTFQHMKDDGLSVDVQFLLGMPVPDASLTLRRSIESEVSALLDLPTKDRAPHELRLDELVNEAFGLRAEERRTIVSSLPPRDPIAILDTDGIVSPELIERDAPVCASSLIQISAIETAAWATPDLVTAEHLALFALIDVIRAFNGSARPGEVRTAAILVRNPAMALAFLDQPQAKQWVRVIGAEARPLPANVVSISQFQKNATDLPWSNAMSQLTGSGALQTGADRWIAADNFPVSSGQDWAAGRAAIAVELVSTVLAAEIEDRLKAFLWSVADGTASRAVS